MNWLSFFIGALVGWLVELIIDVLFWRRRYQGSASEARLRIEMAGIEAEYSQLEAQLVGCQEEHAQCDVQTAALKKCDTALERANAQVSELEREIANLRSELLAAEVQTRSSQAASVDAVADLPQRAAPPVETLVEPDDFTKVEGIGPKISALLIKSDIRTFADLAAVDVARLQTILAGAGSRYRLADPASWPQQARLAAAGDWDALTTLQSDLKGGRHTPV